MSCEESATRLVDNGRMQMLRRIALGSLVVLVTAGCSNKPAPPVQRPPAAKDPFETRADPPITASTRFAAGQFSESQGNFQNAASQYEEALQLDPAHNDSMFRLGIVLARLRQYPQAITTWQRYVKATGGSATAYANLGLCYELAGKPVEAERAYRDAIRKDPRNEPARVNYGLMLARYGHTDEALKHLRAVLSEAEAHFNLASVHEERADVQNARKEYQNALLLDPGFREARERLNRLQ